MSVKWFNKRITWTYVQRLFEDGVLADTYTYWPYTSPNPPATPANPFDPGEPWTNTTVTEHIDSIWNYTYVYDYEYVSSPYTPVWAGSWATLVWADSHNPDYYIFGTDPSKPELLMYRTVFSQYEVKNMWYMPNNYHRPQAWEFQAIETFLARYSTNLYAMLQALYGNGLNNYPWIVADSYNDDPTQGRYIYSAWQDLPYWNWTSASNTDQYMVLPIQTINTKFYNTVLNWLSYYANTANNFISYTPLNLVENIYEMKFEITLNGQSQFNKNILMTEDSSFFGSTYLTPDTLQHWGISIRLAWINIEIYAWNMQIDWWQAQWWQVYTIEWVISKSSSPYGLFYKMYAYDSNRNLLWTWANVVPYTYGDFIWVPDWLVTSQRETPYPGTISLYT